MSGGETKVADVAASLRSRVPMNTGSLMKMFDWYHGKYIKTGRFTPVVHAMVVIGTIGYAIEYPHIKHELEVAKAEATKA